MTHPQQFRWPEGPEPGLRLYYMGVEQSPALAEASRTGVTRIAIVTDGSVAVQANSTAQLLATHDLITLPGALEVTFNSKGQRYRLSLLSFSTAFLLEHSLKITGNDYFNFLIRQSPVKVTLNESAYTTLTDLLGLLATLLKVGNASLFQKEKVLLCFNLFLFELAELYNADVPLEAKRPNRKEKLVLQFLNVLAHHSRREHRVKFYADRLCVSPDYLGKVVGEITGSSVKQYIAQALLAQAKILLATTELSIREISEELEFAQPGFFSNFFKKYAGASPSGYRQANRYKTNPPDAMFGGFF